MLMEYSILPLGQLDVSKTVGPIQSNPFHMPCVGSICSTWAYGFIPTVALLCETLYVCEGVRNLLAPVETARGTVACVQSTRRFLTLTDGWKSWSAEAQLIATANFQTFPMKPLINLRRSVSQIVAEYRQG